MKRIGALVLCALLVVVPVNAQAVASTVPAESTEPKEETSGTTTEAEEIIEEPAETTTEEVAETEANMEKSIETEGETEVSTEETAEVTSTTEEVTNTTEDVTDTTEEVTNTTEDVTGTTEEVTNTTEEVTNTTDVVTAEMVTIPDVIGITEEDAMAVLQAVKLPDGSQLEIIKTYAYSSDVSEDVIYEQTPIGNVPVTEAGKVEISISMGEEPDEVLEMEEVSVNKITSFGIAEYLDEATESSNNHTTTSQFGIDWDSLPFSYEYAYDNSANCWYWGLWKDGVVYKTPVGQYSTDVRHVVQVYCDGTYVYTRVVFATIHWTAASGESYRYFFDGEGTSFRLDVIGGGTITGRSDGMSAGTHQIEVRHEGSGLSGRVVEGSMAYLTKYPDNKNAVVEFKIPLSEMMRQNPNIDMENLGTVQMHNPQLMYRTVTSSGAGTLPLVTAGVSLLVIPGSTILLKKFGKKKKSDEQNV